MKGMKEAAPDELAAVKRRALKSLAMGRIDEADCAYITSTIDGLTGFIYNMNEEGGTDDNPEQSDRHRPVRSLDPRDDRGGSRIR